MKLILSCDGGGIRGAATAIFLSRLEKAIGVKIADKFDMFAGTSTGGIIAGALGCLKMKGDDIAEIYSYANGNVIMDATYWDRIAGIVQTESKYDGKGKTQVLTQYFKGLTLKSAGNKEVLITAYDLKNRRLEIFNPLGKKSPTSKRWRKWEMNCSFC